MLALSFSIVIGNTFIEKAQIQYEKGNYKNAISLYQQAIDVNENITISYFNMANAEFQLNNIYKAIVYYRSSIKSAPDFFLAYQNLAIAYYSLNDMAKTISTVHLALKITPDNEKCQVLLGAAYREAGAINKAILQFEKIINNNYERFDLYLPLAEMYRQLEDNFTALSWLDKYPDSEENYSYALQLKADIYEDLNKIDQACFYLNQVFELSPENSWPLFRLSLLLQRSGNISSALETAEKGVSLFPEFKDMALLAANCAFELKKYSIAEHYYKKALDLGSAEAVIGLENIRLSYRETK